MSTLRSLMWKEWHDARVYLWVGLGVFLGLPVVGGAELVVGEHHRFELVTTPWVIALGGVLAVFVGVGVTTPDRRPKLEDFWRSRPIGVGRWMAVKYAVGLAVLLAACGLPPAVEMAVSGRPDGAAVTLLTFLPFFWAAIYSLAFLAGCMVPRPSHAATLALAAMLLVYLLPVVLPPLAWMNVADFTDLDFTRRTHGWGRDWLGLWGGRQVAFAGGMLGLSAVAAAVAVVGVRRSWRVESGRRTMYGLVATALLLLFASAAYQLATNLPVLQQLELPAAEEVVAFHSDGTTEYVVTRYLMPVQRYQWPEYGFRSRPIEVRPDDIALGPAFDVGSNDNINSLIYYEAAHRGGVSYRVDLTGPPVPPVNELTPPEEIAKRTADVALLSYDARTGRAIGRLPLWTQRESDGSARLYQSGDRAYVYGTRFVVVDLSRPGQPRVLSDVPWTGRATGMRMLDDHGRLTIRLVPFPGLSPAERLDVALGIYEISGRSSSFDGHTLVTYARDDRDHTSNWYPDLGSYRLDALTPEAATFARLGEYHPTLLQRMAGGQASWRGYTLSHGLVYNDGINANHTFNSSVSILNPTGPRPMQMIGHFAAPGASHVHPLADGRAIVGGGHTLWLVGPPPHTSGG